MQLEGYIRPYQNWIRVSHHENTENLVHDVITLLASPHIPKPNTTHALHTILPLHFPLPSSMTSHVNWNSLAIKHQNKQTKTLCFFFLRNLPSALTSTFCSLKLLLTPRLLPPPSTWILVLHQSWNRPPHSLMHTHSPQCNPQTTFIPKH